MLGVSGPRDSRGNYKHSEMSEFHAGCSNTPKVFSLPAVSIGSPHPAIWPTLIARQLFPPLEFDVVYSRSDDDAPAQGAEIRPQSVAKRFGGTL
jgi:hypothetical protein